MAHDEELLTWFKQNTVEYIPMKGTEITAGIMRVKDFKAFVNQKMDEAFQMGQQITGQTEISFFQNNAQ